MRTVADFPFTERIITAHPSLAHRAIGEVALTTLKKYHPVRMRERNRMKRGQVSLEGVFYAALETLNDNAGVRVVQIGAHDGHSDDPLYKALNEHRWSALMVEPTDRAFSALTKLRGNRPNTSLVNKAVTPDGAPLVLYTPVIRGLETFGSVWTSTSEEQVAAEVSRNLGRHVLRTTEIFPVIFPTVAPGQLLHDQEIPENDIQVLVCDIEGQDPPVIEAFMDLGTRPDILMFEHFHADIAATQHLIDRLHDQGYASVIQSEKDTLALL
jgi:hypothetical protein